MKPVWVNGRIDPILVDTSQRVLDAILAAQIPVAMLCGGKGLCATCHVYVEEGAQDLTPVTPRERMSLKMLYDVRPSSRLACQAKVLGPAVKVTVPKGRYLESTMSLDSLIGRRAEDRILHPVNGRVLIEAGKIITRSRINELRIVDVDVAAMREQSQSIKAL